VTGGILGGRLSPSRVLGYGWVSGQAPSPALNIMLGHPGTCPEEPTLHICLFDDSGSMLGGADSSGLRYAEAALVFERIMRRCRCNRELVAILHMNQPTSADRPALSLNRKSGADIVGGLAVPHDGDGASTMGATLERARQIAEAHPRHAASLVAFSDYELTDNIHDLVLGMKAFPGAVHAVVLRSQPPEELLAAQGVNVTHIASGEAPGAVARALFSSVTKDRPGARPVPQKSAARPNAAV
jgi:hypothetical protein